MNYSRGSEWRKWDLHIHTPDSLVNCNYKAENSSDIWETFIIDLEKLPIEFKVIGINDYLFLDGYKKVIEYKKNGRLKNIDLILPVLEFRIKKFAGHKDFKRVNFHVIFSDLLSVDIIQNQFINGLTTKYKLSPGLDNDIWDSIISKDSLIELGRKIKKTVPESELPKYGTDLEEGFNNLNLDEDDIFELLNKSHFKNNFVTAIGKTEWESLSWSDGSIAEKKDIINKVDLVFISSENIEKFNIAKEKLKSQRVNDFLLDCSDAHYNSDSKEKDKIGKCFTWIKADPTFQGFKQVLNEPDERVYVGNKPILLTRVNNNKTKYIKQLIIDTITDKEDLNQVWFKSIKIPLNFELISIIGNKGSGKSAIADIIGLCADTKHSDNFSFLNKEKFKKKGWGDRFKAAIEYASDTIATKESLNDEIESSEEPKVQYIPQNYFEKLCNEIGKIEAFRNEIENVVFQYISEEKKLKQSSFSNLISFKKEAIEQEIRKIKIDIDSINDEIIILEDKKKPEYKKNLESKKAIKDEELKVHEHQKPKEIKNPSLSDESPETKQLKDKLNKFESELVNCENEVKKLEDELLEYNHSIEELIHFKREINSLESDINKFLENKNVVISKYNIDISKLLLIKFDVNIIDNIISEYRAKCDNLKLQLEVSKITENIKFENLKMKNKVEFYKTEIFKIKNSFTANEKEYQNYLTDLKKWEIKKNQIIGKEDEIETLEYLKKELKYISENLNNELENKRKIRLNYSKLIYNKKSEIKIFYDEIKTEIDSKMAEYSEQNLTIDSSFSLSYNFISDFLGFILQNKVGTFRGLDEGKKIFENRIIPLLNCNEENSIENFLVIIIDYLENDRRENNEELHKPTIISEQISKRKEFYNFLFNLDYIEPHYELRQNGKSLEKLSPGEKGALLLVFYLVLDKSPLPLIIDQPEDNLDNHSVAKVLVPYIKSAKKNRQIIMVTHNPNLAIVADAEQIIYVSIDKENANTFNFTSGSIENPMINKKIVDVLEGTMPAFKTRRRKYYENS